MKWYVIDKRMRTIAHEGNEASCKRYIANATSMFGGSYTVAHGVKNANVIVKSLAGNDAVTLWDEDDYEAEFEERREYPHGLG